MSFYRTIARLSILALSAILSGGGASAANAKDPEPYRIEWATTFALRDGVKLAATVFIPLNANGKQPAVLTMTPYVADSYHDVCRYFASHGFVCAVVDVRGRGNSEGKFVPWVNDARDGYDTVEWLAKHAAVDGRVVMWGGSYAGFDQWATASQRPPSLKAIAPAAAAFPSHDYPNSRNIPFYYDIRWLTFTSGKTSNAVLFGDTEYWSSVFYRHYKDQAAFKTLDRYAGVTGSAFQDWVKNDKLNAYWDAMTPTHAQYAAIDIPILNITGSYDDDQGGALEFYRRFTEAASPATLAKHHLIIGPWDHPGTRNPKIEFGGLTFGEASVIDMKALHVAWYNWILRGGAKPSFLDATVKWFEAGTNDWHGAPDLASVNKDIQRYYPTPSVAGSDNVYRAGMLRSTMPQAGASDSYISDPGKTGEGRYDLDTSDAFITDQRDVLRIDKDGLIYQTAPFAADQTFAGRPRFEAEITMTARDADILVRLYEILPDGQSIALASDIIRARYRNSLREAELMTPGKAERFDFDRFNWFARKITKGSRLRLVINSPNSILYQKNYQSGGVVYEETGKDATVATIGIVSVATLSLPVANR